MMLSKDAFIEVIRNTPLVAIDLVVRNARGEILVGYRKNEPAAGTWFVPGGRIRKGETIPQALMRISEAELRRTISVDQARLLGVFTHLYDTNFAEVPGVETHYVVIAYEIDLDLDLAALPADQHGAYRWVGRDAAGEIHENSRPYFRP